MRSPIAASLWTALIVGGASLALYFITLAPTITWANFGADGGDLISAAVTHGIPHPPGYPLYTTLNYLFAQIPIGNAAFRLNLFSAMCMALAAALTTWGLTSNRRSLMGIAILAGLAFAAAPMVWGQATIAEVHALNAMLVAAILSLLAPIVFHNKTISVRRLSFAFFLWGLSLTNLLTALALAPLFFIAIRHSPFTRHSSPVTHHSSLITHHVLRSTYYALPFLLALTPYFLLLPRAAAQPPINWLGAPTLSNFWSLITAELYRGYAFALPLSDYPARLVAFAQLLVAQFGWIGLGLIGLGVYRVRRSILAPLISVALYVIFALGYNTVDSHLYLIPVWLFGAWAIAAGAQTLIHHALRITRHSSSRSIPVELVILLLIVLIPGLSIFNNFAAQDLHADYTAEHFAQTILTAAPADAIIITHRDAHIFTLWYYRLVEKQRADVSIIDARLAGYPWYDPMLHAQSAWRAQDASLIRVEFEPEATWLDRLRAANPTRPVCDVDATTAQLDCQY
jgi:hypothetical protein